MYQSMYKEENLKQPVKKHLKTADKAPVPKKKMNTDLTDAAFTTQMYTSETDNSNLQMSNIDKKELNPFIPGKVFTA